MIERLCGPIHSSVSHGGRGVGRGGKIIWPGGWQGRTMSLFFNFSWCVLGVLSGYSVHFWCVLSVLGGVYLFTIWYTVHFCECYVYFQIPCCVLCVLRHETSTRRTRPMCTYKNVAVYYISICCTRSEIY